MTVSEAIRQSSDGLALLVNRNPDRIVLARSTPTGTRIVKSYTDPTVVRKLTEREGLLTNWEPVELELTR